MTAPSFRGVILRGVGHFAFENMIITPLSTVIISIARMYILGQYALKSLIGNQNKQSAEMLPFVKTATTANLKNNVKPHLH